MLLQRNARFTRLECAIALTTNMGAIQEFRGTEFTTLASASCVVAGIAAARVRF